MSSRSCSCGRCRTRPEGPHRPPPPSWTAPCRAHGPRATCGSSPRRGPRMAALLRALTKHSEAPGSFGRLLAATTRTHHRPVQPAALVEPLSNRELDVLRPFGTDLDERDLAKALTASVSTV